MIFDTHRDCAARFVLMDSAARGAISATEDICGVLGARKIDRMVGTKKIGRMGGRRLAAWTAR